MNKMSHIPDSTQFSDIWKMFPGISKALCRGAVLPPLRATGLTNLFKTVLHSDTLSDTITPLILRSQTQQSVWLSDCTSGAGTPQIQEPKLNESWDLSSTQSQGYDLGGHREEDIIAQWKYESSL